MDRDQNTEMGMDKPVQLLRGRPGKAWRVMIRRPQLYSEPDEYWPSTERDNGARTEGLRSISELSEQSINILLSMASSEHNGGEYEKACSEVL